MSTTRRLALDEVARELGMPHRHVLAFSRSGALIVGDDGLVSEDALRDFARRRDGATQFVAEARATFTERSKRMVDRAGT